MTKGTPRTLDEMLTDYGTQTAKNLKRQFRDFCSQKFTKHLMTASTPEAEKLLKDLWFELTGESK